MMIVISDVIIIDLQVPGGYKFMVKLIIYVDSEIVYE